MGRREMLLDGEKGDAAAAAADDDDDENERQHEENDRSIAGRMDGKEEEATQRMQDLIVKSCEYKYEPGCVALKVKRRRRRRRRRRWWWERWWDGAGEGRRGDGE